MTKQGIRKTPLADLTPHPSNPRQGDIGAIIQSIEANGWYGTLVAQISTGYVLAGNHRLQAARHCGIDRVPVHWVDVDDDTANRILLADNRTTDLATYDNSLLADLLVEMGKTGNLEGTGYDGDDLDDLLADLEAGYMGEGDPNLYSGKIVAPIYEPTGDCPPIHDCYDTTKRDELLGAIDKRTDLPDEIATFLRSAAERHTQFRFDHIAEFYCHADAELQQLMEDSALVIIDFDKAIENGFVMLGKTIAGIFANDYPDGHL